MNLTLAFLFASAVMLLVSASIDAASSRHYRRARRTLDRARALYDQAVVDTMQPRTHVCHTERRDANGFLITLTPAPGYGATCPHVHDTEYR